MKNKTWKEINGFPGYKISDIGEVLSLKNRKPKILKGSFSNKYKIVSLFKQGKQYYKYIHRLIAEHFIPNPFNYKCVLHKDGDAKNNNLNNLYWGTYSQNSLDAKRHNTSHCRDGEENHQAKLTNKQVRVLKHIFKINPKVNKSLLSRMMGVTPGAISHIFHSRSWSNI